MKKCLKCECLYPDYYEVCPACGAKEKKEWKQSTSAKRNRENKNSDKNIEIFTYSTNDLKDIIETNDDNE